MSSCGIDVSVRIAESSCTPYSPTNELKVTYQEGPYGSIIQNLVTKTGSFSYGDVVDFTMPNACVSDSGVVSVFNDVSNGFAVDLVTVTTANDEFVFDAATYSTYALDMHLKNDACWYFDKDSMQTRYNTPLELVVTD